MYGEGKFSVVREESVHGFDAIGIGGKVSLGEEGINYGSCMVVCLIKVLAFQGCLGGRL